MPTTLKATEETLNELDFMLGKKPSSVPPVCLLTTEAKDTSLLIFLVPNAWEFSPQFYEAPAGCSPF